MKRERKQNKKESTFDFIFISTPRTHQRWGTFLTCRRRMRRKFVRTNDQFYLFVLSEMMDVLGGADFPLVGKAALEPLLLYRDGPRTPLTHFLQFLQQQNTHK